MAKFASNEFLDAGANVLIAQGERLVLCSAEPANFAGVAAVTLADVALVAGDYTKADGDVSGRKVTVAAQAAVPVTASGNGNHVAIVDDTNSLLLYVTTAPAQAVVSGGTVDIGAFDIEIADPV